MRYKTIASIDPILACACWQTPVYAAAGDYVVLKMCDVIDWECLVQLIPRLEFSDGVYMVTGNCSDLSDLPEITFVIGGDPYSLPPSAWVLGVRGHCSAYAYP